MRDEVEDPTALSIKNAAMQYLARREHSRRELYQKLAQKFKQSQLIEAVLDEVADKGYLSDLRYAELVVRSRVNGLYGEARIRQELRDKGVKQSIVDTALAEQQVEWSQLAKKARSKRFSDELPESYVERSKEMRFLQRRGFSPDEIRAVYD